MDIRSKKQIDLLMEIRQRVRSEMDIRIKFTNSELPRELIDIHLRSDDAITRSRIRQFLEMLEDKWSKRLNAAVAASESDQPLSLIP